MNDVVKIVLISIVMIFLGFGAGYYYGDLRGVEKGVDGGKLLGRAELLSEQKAAEEAALKEVQEAANPFAEVEEAANPFKDTYKNPFSL